MQFPLRMIWLNSITILWFNGIVPFVGTMWGKKRRPVGCYCTREERFMCAAVNKGAAICWSCAFVSDWFLLSQINPQLSRFKARPGSLFIHFLLANHANAALQVQSLLCFSRVAGAAGAERTLALEGWGKGSREGWWKGSPLITDPERFLILNHSLKSINSAQHFCDEDIQPWDILCTFRWNNTGSGDELILRLVPGKVHSALGDPRLNRALTSRDCVTAPNLDFVLFIKAGGLCASSETHLTHPPPLPSPAEPEQQIVPPQPDGKHSSAGILRLTTGEPPDTRRRRASPCHLLHLS